MLLYINKINKMAVRYQTEDCNFQFKGRRKTSDWIRRVAAAEGYRTGDITVVFCSDAALLEVNRQFLSHDYFTDIITFDYTDQEKKIISGDLMISIDTVRDNAVEFGATFENELFRVIIHGVLHLLGHGDKAPGEEAKMHALEDKYLSIRETDETKS